MIIADFIYEYISIITCHTPSCNAVYMRKTNHYIHTRIGHHKRTRQKSMPFHFHMHLVLTTLNLRLATQPQKAKDISKCVHINGINNNYINYRNDKQGISPTYSNIFKVLSV